MNEEQLALTKIMEECAEIQKICSKSIRFGIYNVNKDRSNYEKLKEEFKDLYVAILNLSKQSEIDIPLPNEEEINLRLERIKKYNNYSKELGILK